MPISVILVDDTGFLRSMLREILEAGGRYRVLAEASDGKYALDLAAELKPDLVLTDLIMPEMDGIELTRALKQRSAPPRVVVAASPDQDGALHNALRAGADDFLVKPFSASEVLGQLQEKPLPYPLLETLPHASVLRMIWTPGSPHSAARARVLLAQAHRWGKVIGSSPEEEALKPGLNLPHFEMTLETPHSSPDLESWLGDLPDIESFSVRAMPKKSAGTVPQFPISRRPARGSLRIRASFLDRLLDRVEQSSRAQIDLSHQVAGQPHESSTRPTLEELGQALGDLRTELLAARLVPFEQIRASLLRHAQTEARGSSKQVRLHFEGSESRMDHSVLQVLEDLLRPLLGAWVKFCIPRSDISRQLGKPEGGTIQVTISRTKDRVRVGIQGEVSERPDLEARLDPDLGSRIRKLEGTLQFHQKGAQILVDLVLPAGAPLIHSYLCQAGGRLFAVPVGQVEKALELDADQLRIHNGRSFWEEPSGNSIPLVRVGRDPWVRADGDPSPDLPALIYRVGPQRYALALDAVLGETDVVIRPLPTPRRTRGVLAAALLPDGEMAWIPDLPHLAREH